MKGARDPLQHGGDLGADGNQRVPSLGVFH